MIRKTFLIIAIITLAALSALGNTPNSSETSAGAKTTEIAAESAVMLQRNCPFVCVDVNQPKLILSQQKPHSFLVSWAVSQLNPSFQITDFRVTISLENSKRESARISLTGVSSAATSASVLIPADKIPQFFSSNTGTKVTATVSANIAQKGSIGVGDFVTVDLATIAPPGTIPTPAPTPPPASNLKLDITDIKINGSNRSNPITMQVTWTVAKPASAFIKGAYNLTMDLSGNGVTGKVVQTPTSSITSVAVGLLGIPTDIRAKLFDPKFPLTATVTLKTTIISDGKETPVEVKESKTFPAIN
jgi:hypothetical protein